MDNFCCLVVHFFLMTINFFLVTINFFLMSLQNLLKVHFMGGGVSSHFDGFLHILVCWYSMPTESWECSFIPPSSLDSGASNPLDYCITVCVFSPSEVIKGCDTHTHYTYTTTHKQCVIQYKYTCITK